jgi:hypothetical protein
MKKHSFKENLPEKEFDEYLGRMKEGNAKSYIACHVLGQIAWLDRKSVSKQRLYKATMIISIIMSSLIPVITLMSGIPGNLFYKIIITALGSGVTALSAVGALCKFKELWIQYRMQCEMLRSILHRFFAECSEFGIGNPSPYTRLVDTCEDYMKKEADNWASMMPLSGSRHSSISS